MRCKTSLEVFKGHLGTWSGGGHSDTGLTGGAKDLTALFHSQ